MNFDQTEEQQAIDAALGRYLGDRYPPAHRRNPDADQQPDFDPEQWARFAELGMIAALFDTELGGLGGQASDIATLFKRLGGFLVIEPFLATAMAARLVGAQAADALPGQLIAGERLAVPAFYEPGAGYDASVVETRAVASDGGWRLIGAKELVPHAVSADFFLVSARLGSDIALFQVPADAPGLQVADYACVDGGRAGDLTLDGVPLPAEARIAQGDAAWHRIKSAVGTGMLALCWEAVGIMDRVRDDSVAYLDTRLQFGRPLGKFQALQHRMATLALEIEQARSACIAATAELASDPFAIGLRLSAAKYTIGRIGALVAEEAVQMHGGMGMTWELDLSHFCKRLILIDHALGDEDMHLACYLEETMKA